ncbi:MAG: helix-turn-helix domain-containing protein, partial [Desulfocapsa sp.]|nr:helix-turn-helix domain-containing protein [Desulfocapsa sp.]
MSHEETQEVEQTLGNFFREHREKKGLSLDEISEATKISPPVLKAIEEDDYKSMPADAFCRGFYTLYANFLDLDTVPVLQRYEENRGISPKGSKNTGMPPGSENPRFTNYAEPSSISPATSMSIFALLCLILFSGACWYFKFNPIDYVNTKLLPPETPIEVKQTEVMVEADTEAIETDSDVATQAKAEELIDTSANTTEESDSLEPLSPIVAQGAEEAESPAVTLYHVEINFDNSGTMKVTLDDSFVLNKQFSAGETLQWEVKEK